ncbi:MAG: tRNA 5-methylaminomethyl-2-thiouridine biosynthesis bifunctional protein, partial [Alteromonadaceae bacterium]
MPPSAPGTPVKPISSATITPASIHFDASGAPVSNLFGDFYFNTDNGLLEAEYVFINGNSLPERWFTHPSRHFVIGETGFGSGLNFLTSWACFNQSQTNTDKPPSVKQLHFISFEKFPLKKADLATALTQWPQLTQYAGQLVAQYPQLLPGCHRLSFEQGTVILDLWFGDITDTLPQLFHGPNGCIDAWYLDGFSPSKNADMWSSEIYQAMVTLSKPEATLATFTAAGVVKRQLQEVGFTIKKITGYGKKREMITGTLKQKTTATILPPFYYRHANARPDQKKVAIIGGGIASAAVCYALAKRGFQITLYCKDPALAQGASQNRQGALYPLLHADYDSLSEFYSHAYLYALRLYHQLHNQQLDFSHSFCGVLIQAFNDKVKQRQQSLIDKQLWPASLLRPLDSAQAS